MLDSLIAVVGQNLSQLATWPSAVTLILGTVLPMLIGFVLTRKKTVQYGRLINKTVGTLLLQKRFFGVPIPESLRAAIIMHLQSTLQDMAFGISIDSRTDLTPEQKQQKIDEYLGEGTKEDTKV